MRIIYSFNKRGWEGENIARELAAASDERNTIIPFNHQNYLDPSRYKSATELDRVYRSRDPGLLRMYSDFLAVVESSRADAVIVDNCAPYHPDFLRNLNIYKVLYSTDDNINTYHANIPFLHAYHHVIYCNQAYSPDLTMREKMRYSGMVNADWVPLGVFDHECDATLTESNILAHDRPVDVVYVGGFYREKVEMMSRLQRALGRGLALHGTYRLKHNLYANVRHGALGWVKPITMQERRTLYQNAKIGINIHVNAHIMANQRLYHLPANGVMQICDNPELLADGSIYEPGKEIATFKAFDDLIDTIRHYLKNDTERRDMALAGFRRTKLHFTRDTLTKSLGGIIERGMKKLDYVRGAPTPLDKSRVDD